MAPWLRQFTGVVAAASAATPKPALNEGFSNATISRLRSNLLDSAEASWEKGTAAEALTELEWGTLSVFDKAAFPPPSPLPASKNASDVLKIVDDVIAARTTQSKALIDGQGSVADPASLGVAVLLANWTRSEESDDSYSDAASQQLDYLLNGAPRTSSGAISHRADQVQLWADYVYMVPPFIAYYGALQGGQEGKKLLQEAYDQISLYRDTLRDEGGLWRHVALGNWTDDTHWTTGGAWAAAGMLRVLQTLNHSSVAKDFKEQQANLTEWVQELTEATWEYQAENGTLYNVVDNPSTFADSSSTALFAAVTYRLAAFTKNTTQVDFANKAFQLVQDSVDEEGWLTQTVDPMTFSTPSQAGEHSPEGQAFTLLLQAAWRDYTKWVESESKED